MRWIQPLRYFWAAPASLLGLIVWPIVRIQGGRAQIVDGVIEIYGGVVTRILASRSAAALTLGHVVWGQNQHCLEVSRRHERVHVRQYESWRPFFIPAYLLSSLLAYFRGRNPYLDNYFEREAYESAP